MFAKPFLPIACAILLTLTWTSACAAGSQDRPSAEVVAQLDHEGSVSSITFSRDGRFVLTTGDTTVKLWDFATGKLIRTFADHQGNVFQGAFSPDGHRVFSISSSTIDSISWDILSSWDIATGKLARGRVKDILAISPDSRLLLTDSSNKMHLLDPVTGRELRSFGATGRPAVFSADGRLVLTADTSNTLKLWDVKTGNALKSFRGHKDTIEAVALSPDGSFALSGSRDNTTKLWNLRTGKELRTIKFGSTIDSVEFTSDGQLALINSDLLYLWDLRTGKEVRTFPRKEEKEDNGFGWVTALTSVFRHDTSFDQAKFSPDGRFVLTHASKAHFAVWDVATGEKVREFAKADVDRTLTSVVLPDGRTVLSGTQRSLSLWDISTGRELRSLRGNDTEINIVAFTHDGRVALSNDDETLTLWNTETGRELKSFGQRADEVTSAVFSPDGQFVLTVGDKNFFRLWDVVTGKEIRSFGGPDYPERDSDLKINAVAISPDGRLALSGASKDEFLGDFDGTLTLWELATGKRLRSFTSKKDLKHVWRTVAFSPDGKFALSGGGGGVLDLWDVTTGNLIRSFADEKNAQDEKIDEKTLIPPEYAACVDGSRDKCDEQSFDRWFMGLIPQQYAPCVGDGNSDKCNKRSFERWLKGSGPQQRGAQQVLAAVAGAAGAAGAAAAVSQIFPLGGDIKSAAFSPDGRLILSAGENQLLQVWDVATGKLKGSMRGHTGEVTSVAFSPDGHLALSSAKDGTTRIWDLATGRELARRIASPGEWVIETPEGFFSASSRGDDLIAVARDFEITKVEQLWYSLFSPDLVREALAGDPNAEVKQAANILDIDRVLDSGPPPLVEITSAPSAGESDLDVVTIDARITDRGKGIGRIEWRVNGVTAAVARAPAGAGPRYQVKQTLALDPGENTIEVVAYNERNLLASLPAHTNIAYTGPPSTAKPKLFMLAVGINNYHDEAYKRPGSAVRNYFPPLKLAVRDAEGVAAEFKKAAEGLYGDGNVYVKTVLDGEATAANLDLIVEDISKEISPRDTFVLFAAGHGYSNNGRFFLIPEDYQGGTNPEALASRAIDQIHLQDWTANRIKAKKAVILIDTCESGSLTNSYAHSRVDGPASDAAIGRLHEATGRPVLTAAAAGKSAYEGDKGHSVFTYALMEALHQGDTNNNGKIELSELAAYVERRVPELFGELKSDGWAVKGVSLAAARGSGSDGQTARFGSTGDDFSLVGRLQDDRVVPAAQTTSGATQTWDAVKDKNSSFLLELFIEYYGDTIYGDLARARLDELKKSQVAVAAPRPPPVCPNGEPLTVSWSSRLASPLSRAEECALKPKDVFKECDKCPAMVSVPTGSFMMGSPESEKDRQADEGPQHQVNFSKPFAVGKFAVTFDEWDACVADGGCDGFKPRDEGWGRGRRPVINVNWGDAKMYVAWLSRKTGSSYRLLSESEREYVTRAGTTTPFWWGSTTSTNQAACKSALTVPVNPWGFYQVHGNVSDWTEDCWNDNYNGAPSDGSAWTTGECSMRIIRGGDCRASLDELRSAFRSRGRNYSRDVHIGFRVARTLTP